MHLVSICMPVYNRPQELERAMNSVLSQSYTNIEIIVSNNSSTNLKVDELMLDFVAKDKRIRYFNQLSALPVIANFQFVLEKAVGDYFMWLADDDWIDSNYIEQCMNFLIAHQDYNIACGKNYYHYNTGEFQKAIFLPSINLNSNYERVISFYKNVNLNGYFYGIKKTVVSKKSILQNKIGFDWLYIAKLVYTGKAEVINTTILHITAGGLSNDSVELNKNLGANNFFTRNLIGLTVSVNAAFDIFENSIYAMGKLEKIAFSIRVFITVYSKTFMWDFVHIKRMIFGIPKNKH